MKKHTLISALGGAVVCILLLATAAAAQPGSGGPSGPSSPTEVPLDGGASLLLAGGIGYGLKRLRDRRAKK